MPSGGSENTIYQFKNCRILQGHQIIQEDFWVRNGKILNPEKLFYEERAHADVQVDCGGNIIAPGYIDVQINGAYGVDFSHDTGTVAEGVQKVAKGLLQYGVTSFCPTVVTSPKEDYQKIVSQVKKCNGSKEGAGVLGLHLEGPFISIEKKGAHNEQYIRTFPNGYEDVIDMYGNLDNVAIVTLAPELERSSEVIQELCKRGIKVSLGHSVADLVTGEEAMIQGASMITHLFNAMLSFHHRDPHLIGMLSSNKLPDDRTLYFGLIADGIHTHPAALRIAYRVHQKGLVLVTDAIAAMGLPTGRHHMGTQELEIVGKRAMIAGTQTLCGRQLAIFSWHTAQFVSHLVGNPKARFSHARLSCYRVVLFPFSISPLDYCVRNLLKNTGCGVVHALESASLHPAEMLDITDRKGTLDYDTDADFIILDEALNVQATYIAGEKVWDRGETETQ